MKTRLQITEDRLFQERANRAGKLSEVEEKLLAENARLKVNVKTKLLPSWILFCIQFTLTLYVKVKHC